MDIARISTISPGHEVQVDFAGLDDWTAADRRILALLYGHGWPGDFDPAVPDLVIPLAAICSRSGLDEDGVVEALSRLSQLTVCLTEGVRSITAPVFRIYQVRDTGEGEAIFAYVIPSDLAPYCSEVAARASGLE